MSVRNHDKIEVSEDINDAQAQADETLGEKFYEEELFKTTKKVKSGDDNNEHEFIQQPHSIEEEKTFLEEEKENNERKKSNDFKGNLTFQNNLTRSREIHRQLMNKRIRWKPSELEIAILKLQFDKNSYPSKEEKEGIISTLEEKFKSRIDINQISRWFQHEREKGVKHGNNSAIKSTYKKFSREELDYLKDCFDKNTYPKTEEMTQISKKLGVSLSKIENWYKHNRRSLAKKGHFSLKTKKYFKKDEVSYLAKMFDLYPRPTKDQVTEMAKDLNCSESQIKNWYSNKRKKQKLLAKRKNQLNDAISQVSNNTQNTFNPIVISPKIQSEPILNAFPLNASRHGSNPTSSLNGFFDQKIMTPTILPKVIQPAQQVMPNFPGVPLLLIPAPSMNANTMSINSNVINNNAIFDEQLKPNNGSPKLNPDEKMQSISMNNNSHNSFNQFTPDKIYMQKLRQQGAEMSTMNWVTQTQTFPMQSPVIIIANKPMAYPNQQVYIANNGVQNAMPTGMQAGIPMNMATPMPNNMPIGNGISNGVPMGQQMVSFEPPMQVQYLTSLYAPYSNNNIFSNYYPVMYQNGPGMNFQPIKPNGIDLSIQGNLQQRQTNNMKPLNSVMFNNNMMNPSTMEKEGEER